MKKITVETVVKASPDKVWKCWTDPAHIIKWNFASDDWHCPAATNDLRRGGKFSATMAAKDGSFSFDFGGTYTEVKDPERIAYTLGDGRDVEIDFKADGDSTRITQTFVAEETHTEEQQRSGWQAIMDNFRKHVESLFGNA